MRVTRRTVSLVWIGVALGAGCSTSSPDSGSPPGAGDDSSPPSGGQNDAASGGSVDAGGSSSGVVTSHDSGTSSGTVDSGASSAIDAAVGTILDGDAGTCPAPSGLTANQTAALQLVNQTRAAMGAPCATMVPALNTSAADHCTYYAANQTTDAGCVADPHTEVQGCADFVAAQFSNREKAAGYTGQPSSETMAFSNNGASSVQQWIDSVWHRTPVLSPWTRDLGYGSATKCDTMDFGNGAAAPANLVVTYPYEGQTGVPTSFNGNYEGPMPPAPPSGWPSGYPIHVYARGATITTHEFSVDGGAQLSHQWITPQTNQLAQNTVILYGDSPLTPGTRYRVHVAGTGMNNTPIDVNITFTTK